MYWIAVAGTFTLPSNTRRYTGIGVSVSCRFASACEPRFHRRRKQRKSRSGRSQRGGQPAVRAGRDGQGRSGQGESDSRKSKKGTYRTRQRNRNFPGRGSEARDRGRGGGRDYVSLAALAPTLLELLGLPSSDPAFDADSFAPLARGEGGAPEAVFSEVDYHQHPGMRASQRMVLVHPHKLIEDRLSGGVSLFDLSEDPGEQRDLSARRPEVVASLRAELARIVTALGDAAPAPAAPLSEEARERLRDLGYLE